MPISSAERAVIELAASRHGVFTRLQAAQLGVAGPTLRRWLRDGRIVPCRGQRDVFVVAGSPPTFDQRLTAVTASRPRPVLSHRTAAALHGFDGFRHGLVEVTLGRGQHRPAAVDVVHWSGLRRRDVDQGRMGVRRTGVLRTMCDLGSVVEASLLERALDDVLRRGVPLWGLRQEAEALHRPGQRGTGALLRLVDQRRVDPVVRDSWFEQLVEACLAAEDLPPVVRQFAVVDADGSVAAKLDLAVPSVRLGLEAHSRLHHFGPTPERLDEHRDVRLAALGWEVLYLGWHHTHRPAEVLDVVRRVVDRRRGDLAGSADG